MIYLQRILRAVARRHLALVSALALAFGAPLVLRAADVGQAFGTPEEAVAALETAVRATDPAALRTLFGPAAEELQNPDRVQATNELETFASALSQSHRIVRQSDSRCVLEVGESAWPFPVPIIKQNDQWFFDTESGKEEILNRRIGKNELSTLQVVRAYVEAQREYAAKDRDGDEVLEYAQKLRSSPGKKDGLYWPPELDNERSPLGPLVVEAQAEGYAPGSREPGTAPEPFHGYFFKILNRQSQSTPGGRYHYVVNGNMIGGFGLVAWPAEYGESGIMTFIVNQLGRVYQKDLGPQTAKSVKKMNAYNLDKTWAISPD
ncbi:MAG: DUF2950 domain-containing protein [Limisphaerales bacterium]